MFNIVGRRWAKQSPVCSQRGLGQGCPLTKGVALKLRRKQVCLNSSLSCALLKRASYEGVYHSHHRLLYYFKNCIFMTTLLILNLDSLCIYNSGFLAIK